MKPGRFRVLLVDDDLPLLASMEAILAEQFDVKSCESPYEALRSVQGTPFHVVCADWQMPSMDGLQFFRTMWSMPLPLKPCCILITAHTIELIDQVSYEDRKMLGMLRKPFKPSALLERVSLFAGVADLKRSSQQLAAAVKGKAS